jgi:hypothetical protein
MTRGWSPTCVFTGASGCSSRHRPLHKGKNRGRPMPARRSSAEDRATGTEPVRGFEKTASEQTSVLSVHYRGPTGRWPGGPRLQNLFRRLRVCESSGEKPTG